MPQRIYATDLTLLDEDGNETTPRAQQWVELRPRVRLSIMRTAAKLLRIAEPGETDFGQVAEAFEELISLLRRQIVEWNWTDLDTGEPLDARGDGLWELTQEELMWLLNQLMAALQVPNEPVSP